MTGTTIATLYNRHGAIATPVWGTAGDCSTCHLEAPTSGSHDEHLAAVGVACNDCHDGAVQGSTAPAEHMDLDVDVYDASAGDLGYPTDKTKGSAYTNCTTASCHDDGTGTTIATPVWGTAGDCSTCHLEAPTSGSHDEHLAAVGVACNDCHDGAVQGSTAPAEHMDLDVDVYDASAGDLGYPSDKTKGSAYTNCTTASCHDDGTGTTIATPVWGTAGDCSTCHLEAPTSGSHDEHLAAVGVACNDCHDGAVQGSTAPAEHMDLDVDVYDASAGDLGYPTDKTKGSAYTNCTTASCHDDGTGTTIATPTWGTAGDCSTCHLEAPTSGSHDEHLAAVGVACNDCHDGAVQGSTAPAEHMDLDVDVYDASQPETLDIQVIRPRDLLTLTVQRPAVMMTEPAQR